MEKSKEPLVDVRGLNLSRGDFFLKDIHFTIHAGEILAIIGKTGAGKTMLLETIVGFTTPSSGEVRYGGIEIQQIPLYARNIGYLYQDYSLFPHLTAEANIGYGLKMKGLSKKEIGKGIEEIANRFGITHVLGQYPGTLSGGEGQRVALARALITRPSLLLLDEPFSALDPVTKQGFYRMLREIQQDFGCAVVFVTHDFIEAAALADRIGVLLGGRLCGIVPSHRLYTEDWSPEVQAFLGMGMEEKN
ncbi:MAG: ATP-binding cassette domain-containing protein, partial [Eubacterium sp.]